MGFASRALAVRQSSRGTFAVWVVWLFCFSLASAEWCLLRERFGCFAFALASAYCLRASCVAVWCFGLCAGIRVMPSCFMRRRLVFWPLRWHSRYAFVLHALPFGVLAFALASAYAFMLHALPFGVLAFALASALCLRASCVAPVRGGTYFSLPPSMSG
ncbi:hypothetical protein SB861_17075 [Paraburkholderia sp. SIMBA_049]